ncbi:MAG: type II toxin-antitoxin system HicA family toxin [Firmicutes bacterium]|nr:type II toxin-antitoxin system HicA family toxin [Bacillota bacterium]
MTFKEIEKLIKQDGWYLVKVVGSHYQYKHPTKKGKITIPHHGGDLKIKTANEILKSAGLK